MEAVSLSAGLRAMGNGKWWQRDCSAGGDLLVKYLREGNRQQWGKQSVSAEIRSANKTQGKRQHTPLEAPFHSASEPEGVASCSALALHTVGAQGCTSTAEQATATLLKRNICFILQAIKPTNILHRRCVEVV